MKYPSVFFATAIVWFVIDVLALYFNETDISYRLYLLSLIFSLALFYIGFWRNK